MRNKKVKILTGESLCLICDKQISLQWHMLHMIARHWEYIQALHMKPDLYEFADKQGV